MLFLEAVGAIFSILGAYLMSTSTKKNTKPLYYGFASFFISNAALLTFFTFKGKIPIIIQMILFFVTAILGIYRHSPNMKRDMFLVCMACTALALALIKSVVPQIQEIDFSVLPIDFAASSLAIFGSYLLSSHRHTLRGYAFICFFIADVVFVYIGYRNAFYFFMVQSMFYLYTSVKGYTNTMHEELRRWLK
ncbi:hypothetical protein [Candidatus Marinarcus aquaticus]|uniref:Nicotinamide riboside transporter PnuC n=1 Tax=Candidatus Marinarcus aquaticus TaxID=2044504 RepID=A0A4Q0XV40_9BACT|nr:hypothetical protein [Candidatus Marinarcus aquaticus]RXJ60019.1 hypothetical protein CRV04_03115 [Candidatus Marinarcus aquaticus]